MSHKANGVEADGESNRANARQRRNASGIAKDSEIQRAREQLITGLDLAKPVPKAMEKTQ